MQQPNWRFQDEKIKLFLIYFINGWSELWNIKIKLFIKLKREEIDIILERKGSFD